MMVVSLKNKINYSFIVLVLILSLGVLLSACSSPKVVEPITSTPIVDDVSQGMPVPSDVPVEDMVVLDDVVLAESKSEVQKTQDTINQVIADGTYEDQVTYRHHEGSETIDISVTVKDDVITAASIQAVGKTHPVSAKYIKSVDGALADLVVGKNIAQLDIPRKVSGSSLTTAAFKGYIDSLI